MRIVVEGPDGSGKSTFTRVLSTATGMAVIHAGGPPKTIPEAEERVNGLWTRQGIFERTLPTSDIIYAKIMRESDTILPEPVLRRAILRMIGEKTIFVYCRPTWSVLLQSLDATINADKSWKPVDHRERVVANYSRIVLGYDELFSWIESRGGIVLRYAWKGELVCVD